MFFRVDKRDFKVSEIIPPNPENYQDTANFSNDKKIIESIFEENKPDHICSRRDCLFLFQELYDAIKFWIKLKGGKLYLVEVEEADFILKSDMIYTEIIKNLTLPQNIDEAKEIVKKYWSGGLPTFKNCWEVMVRKAKVIKLLCVDEEVRLNSKKQYSKLIVEDIDIYRNILFDLYKK